MNRRILEAMHARARAVRTRAAIRSWGYRQRRHAAGGWFRLRRTLADARLAFAIGEGDTKQLIAEGYAPESCGSEIEPAKTILFVDETRLATIEDRRAIAVGLGPDFMAARYIALVPFDGR
jgi:hypothetical protein